MTLPRNARDELLWDVSYALEQQHRGQFAEDGQLVCCDQEFPCPSAQLAARGLLAAEDRGKRRRRNRKAKL